MIRYPTSRIVTRADMYYACNLKLGEEGDEHVLPLFGSTMHYEEVKSPSKQYLEEDRTYIPLRSLAPVVMFEGLALICAPKEEVWTIGKEYIKTKYDGTLWDVDVDIDGTRELANRLPVDEETGRANTAYKPRIPRVSRYCNFRELPANICLRDGPLILGLHEMVVPIPRDLQPGFGVAREIFQLFRQLKAAITKELGKTKVGDIVVCKVKAGYHSAHLYMPMARESTSQFPCFEPYDLMMKRILEDARKRKLSHLTVMRAPGKHYAENWETAVKYYSRAFWNTPVIGLVLRGVSESEAEDYTGNTYTSMHEDQDCPGAAKVQFGLSTL